MAFTTAIIFIILIDAPAVPSLANVSLFKLTPNSWHMVLNDLLTSGMVRRLILCVYYPRPGISHFSKKLWFPLFPPKKNFDLSSCIPENHYFPVQ